MLHKDLQGLSGNEQVSVIIHLSEHPVALEQWGIERKETKEVMGTIGFNAWVPYHKKQSLVTNSIQNTGGTGTFQKRCQKFFLTVLKR